MQVLYEHKAEMTLIGYSTKIRHDEGCVRCPEFWEKEYSKKYARLWRTMRPETPTEKAILENEIGMFAICEDGADSFEYWIAGLYRGGDVPTGLKLCTIPESDWAMFSTKGALPDALQRLSAHVFNEWLPNEGGCYACGSTMLEVYTAGDMQSPDYESGIWVPVKLK